MKPNIAFFVILGSTLSAAPVLDARKILEKQDFLINRDYDWYEKNIPFFDSPDEEINKTYYYRWELVTRHIVYGNPNSGYAFTEFANRPFWSGAYGTISCPSGHQIYEVRWLQNPRYVRDYLRFWMRHPGAQPRNYSSWLADSAWATHQVHPHNEFITDLLPDLVRNFQEWEKKHWVEDVGLFWQTGHDDGMEFDINAQQTKDILRGGQSLRPSFNAYMWADAMAISQIAKLKGDTATAELHAAKAKRIKENVQSKLWDPSRMFFFPMSNQEHEKDGFIVKKHTLTYETGKFAGSIFGRELHGYVPWAFNMLDPGHEDAWQFLNDDAFFQAPFGPTSIERNDPQFVLKDSCCWWSGQSWPFATTQTLKAMANLLHNYPQKHVNRDDYAKLLHTFAITHRKDGKPYIAEAANPFNGSWKGHDMENRSEHYFHSGFTDLIITGLAGLKTSADDNLEVEPLAPDSWDYFAVDRIPYQGHQLAIVWDRSGERYNIGKGLQILLDGKTIASSPKLSKLRVKLPTAKVIAIEKNPDMNFAVNNDGDYFPRYEASFVHPSSSLAKLSDGQAVYDIIPSNRWSCLDSPNVQDWVQVNFGSERAIHQVKLCVIDDAGARDSQIKAPSSIRLESWTGSAWKEIPNIKINNDIIAGNAPFTATFPLLKTSRLRATLTHAAHARSSLTEFEAWGPCVTPYEPAPPPAGNLAFHRRASGFPKVSASHSDPYGGVPPSAIDGKINFEATPTNRWTSYSSPNAIDWLELEWDKKITVGKVILHIYDDRGGVQAPQSYRIEGWTGTEWKAVSQQFNNPAHPTGGMANIATFMPISVQKLRVVFTHKNPARSGVTEMEVWEK